MTSLRSYELLGAVEAAGVRSEVRFYRSTSRGRMTTRSSFNVLSFHLAPTPRIMTRRASAVGAAFAPLGPLAYLDRADRWETNSNGQPVLALMSFFGEEFSGHSRGAQPNPFNITDTGLMDLMRMLYDEIRMPGFGSHIVVESVSDLLRIKLMRLLQRSAPELHSAGTLSRHELRLITDVINDSAGAVPTVEELASLCKMSRRTLLRRFHETTSGTISDYVANSQLGKSKRLLSHSALSIKQIAHEVGFTSASNFAVAFKRRSGVTPGEFRSSTQK